MSKQQSIHLFNCDQTYKLDAVEDWLKSTKPKLLKVEQHYFPLAKMSEMSNETIPGLQMDVAVFVVHAHESRLSINEQNAGIGYAKIYRALLQATENVIIVIGGDDNYKNEDEEDKAFISRWAKRKVSSQFSEEYMDGRKSFIFSWNQKHRDIHEEALRHFFDSRKKGQKFEYQPKRRLPPKPSTPSLKAQDKGQSSRIHSASPERTSTKDPIATPDRNEAGGSGFHGRSNRVPRPKEVSPSGVGKTPHEDLAIIGCKVSHTTVEVVRQVFDTFRPSLNISTDIKVENFSPGEAVSYLLEKPPRFCVLVVDAATVQDAYEELPRRREEYELLLTTAANSVVKRVIVMISGSCSLSTERDEAIFKQTIRSVLHDTGKGFVVWVKDNQISVEPKVLLQMILGCPTLSLNTQPQRDFAGYYSPPTNAADVSAARKVQSPPGDHIAGDFSMPTNAANVSGARKVQSSPGDHRTSHPLLERHDVPLGQELTFNQLNQTLPKQTPDPVSGREYLPPVGGFVMLKTRLFRGVISDKESDIEIFLPGFKVPDYMERNLREKHSNTPEAMVKITWERSGQLFCSVLTDSKAIEKEGSLHLKKNETVVLKTCVRDGRISMEEGDLEFIYPHWKIPDNIIYNLNQKYWSIREVQLCVISDEKGDLRVQELTTRKERAIGTINRAKERIKKHF